MGSDPVRLLIDAAAESRAALARAIEDHPRWPDLLVTQGIVRYLDGADDEATTWFERALELNPGYLAAISSLGHTALRAGRLGDAGRAFDALAALAPESGWTSYDRAILESAAGRHDEALALLTKAERRLPRHPLPRRARALVALARGDVTGAALALKRAARTAPLFAEELREAGVLDRTPVDAAAARRWAGAVEPNRAVASWYGYVAAFSAGRGLLDEARAWHRRALHVSYDLDAWFTSTGQLLAAAGREEDALETYAAGLAQCPDAVRLRVACGYEFARLGDTERAARFFEEARDLAPGWADVHFNLGLVRYEQNDMDGAIDCYLEALRINPRYAVARNALAFTLLRRGDAMLAQAEYERTLGTGLTSADILVNVARIHLQGKELTKALQVLEEAVRLNPDFAPAYFHLGNVYQELGMARRARAARRRFLNAASDTEKSAVELATAGAA